MKTKTKRETKEDKPNVPNRYGETPIYLAAHQGHSEIVIILSPLTGDPNTSDNDGKTPIHWAARHLESFKTSNK